MHPFDKLTGGTGPQGRLHRLDHMARAAHVFLRNREKATGVRPTHLARMRQHGNSELVPEANPAWRNPTAAPTLPL